MHSFQGPRVDSCLTLGNELSKETHVLTKQKTLLERGAWVGEQQGERTQENCSAVWLTGSGFMIIRLALQVVSGQSSYLCLWSHLPVKMVSSARVSGRSAGRIMGGCLLTPYALFWILPAGSNLSVLGFMWDNTQAVIMLPGHGWNVSVSGSLTKI